MIIDNSSFKKKSDIHLARKLWHALGVGTIFTIYFLIPNPNISVFLLALAWVSFVPVDILRQSRPQMNAVLLKLFKPIIRQGEVNRLAGTTYLISGLLFIAALFPRPIVEMSMLFLALADPFASYIGIRFGRNKIFGHKSIEGFIAAFVVCAAVAFLYFKYAMHLDSALALCLCAGLIGALSELIPVFKLDDNFTMPVLSATGLFVVFQIFGL